MSTDQDKLDEQKRIFGIAYGIAEKAHAGVFRGLPDARPYFEHVKDVAAFFPDWETKTVAILHDTIEDSDITMQDLLREGIPDHIVVAVDAMTKPRKTELEKLDEASNPALKRKNYIEYVRLTVRENPLARKVKIADNYVNMRDLIASGTVNDEDRKQLNKYAESIKILTEPN
jgi:(p)ppGpp synthase/HD superfamily hydrolase